MANLIPASNKLNSDFFLVKFPSGCTPDIYKGMEDFITLQEPLIYSKGVGQLAGAADWCNYTLDCSFLADDALPL